MLNHRCCLLSQLHVISETLVQKFGLAFSLKVYNLTLSHLDRWTSRRKLVRMAPEAALDMKPMRKGTRSCRECRRRKIKCNWTSDAATICNECSKHNRQCAAQGIVVDKFRVAKPERQLSVKVNRIESIVERLAKLQDAQLNERPGKGDHDYQDLQAQLADLDHLDEQARKTSPLYGLFNNDVITQVDKTAAPSLNTTSVISFGNHDLSDLDKLKSTISQEPNILEVLDVATDWWIAWRHQAWALRDHKPQSLRSFVESKVESTDPVMYSLGLMSIALALQQMRPGQDDVALTVSPSVLMDRILAAVDTITLTKHLHDENAVLVSLQRAKTHAEGNQLRKSWLRIRHAILMTKQSNFAESPEITLEKRMFRQRWVGSIYEMDTYLSMVLGFPHADDPNFTDTLAMSVLKDPSSEINLRMRAFRRALAIIASKVNNRNATSPDPSDASIANSLQERLNEVASYMPACWWDTTFHTQNLDAQEAHEHLMTQMEFWQIQAFSHLPHMLVANSSPDLAQNRVLCLQGARTMLSTFCALRGTPAFSVFVCSCEDFQGVFTSCLLLVGLLLHMSQGTYPTDMEGSFQEDMAIIAEVKDIFRYRAVQQGGQISKQGLKAIEELESCLFDGNTGGTKSIILPYFGLIKIESKARAQETTQSYDGMTLPNEGQFSDPQGFAYGGLPSPPASLELTPEAVDPSKQPSNDLIDQGFENVDFNSMFADPNIDWDQFLFGNELATDWNHPGECSLGDYPPLN